MCVMVKSLKVLSLTSGQKFEKQFGTVPPDIDVDVLPVAAQSSCSRHLARVFSRKSTAIEVVIRASDKRDNDSKERGHRWTLA
jgi:hypothetical protein